MGIGEDFSSFKAKYNLNAETMDSIAYRYKRITRQLNIDFWGSNSDTAHSWYVGSYGRDTAAYGVSDVDMGFVLPSQVYQQYHDYAFNGQSSLLQAVKKSVQRTYKTSESFGDGQVVVINFTDGVTFELLPAFVNTDGQTWTYPNSNNGGSWLVCNPWAEMKAVSDRSKATNRNMKHLCRMIRLWRDTHAVPISGMLIDTLAYQFLEKWEFRDKSFLYHDFMARDFFAYMGGQVSTQNHWRAPGSGSYVFRKGPFEARAKRAHALALEAIALDAFETRRRNKWREIFGSRFPLV